MVALHTSHRSLSASSPSTVTLTPCSTSTSTFAASYASTCSSSFTSSVHSRRLWPSSGGCLLLFSCSFVLVLPHPPAVSGVQCACQLLLGHWLHTGLEDGWADFHLQLERYLVRRLRHLPRHHDVSFMIPSLTGPRRPVGE